MRYNTLLNFSGGIDSLYCLWEYAKRKEPLLIHFCHLVNWTGRGDHEFKAVEKALEWIDKNEPFDYQLKTTRFDYGNVCIVQDKEVIGFLTGVLLRDPNYHITNLVISSNKEDMARTGYYLRSEADRLRLIEAVGRRRVKYLYPIKDKRKEQLIRELPAELLELAWYCRTPGTGTEPCGKCQTCKKVNPVLAELLAPQTTKQ